MANGTRSILKLTVVVCTVALALLGICYVLDFFSGAYLKSVVLKVMAVMAITTGASLVTMWASMNKAGR